MLEQISIFSENKKGALSQMTEVLMNEGFNLQAMIVNDSAEFGIVRFLVDDGRRAQNVMKKAGYICHLDLVFGVVITDEVGSLHKLLKAAADAGINIDYIYMSHDRSSSDMIAVFHTEDIEGVEDALTWRGYKVL